MSLSTTSGFRLLPGRLSPAAQAALLEEVAAGLADAPLVRQATPGGKLMVWLLILFGLATALFHFLSMAGQLPVYLGN